MSKKKIYTVSTAHLDTVWSWNLEKTISKYIYKTIVDNIALFNKYPNYVFSFEGAYRYELMEEYYPALFEEVKKYVSLGKWCVSGSSYENGDVNIPSPEALFRNILYGNEYFKNTFGKTSTDIFLPDCFGFGYALPTIIKHSNLKGFTTQKLTWGCSEGVPFDIGRWYGVDGSDVYASLNPGNYVKCLTKIRNYKFAKNKLENNSQYGLDCTYLFEGVGDTGGAPLKSSVKCLEKEIAKNETDSVDVLSVGSDYIFNHLDETLSEEQRQELPKYNGELLMTKHGTGCYTSRAISKRWNRQCEELAEMAEKNSVVARYLGVCSYNQYALDNAWKRFIKHQFHDDITGTACEDAYLRSWNDYGLSMNQLSSVIESSLGGICSLMTTNTCKGVPVVVSNTYEFSRIGAITVEIADVDKEFVRVYDDKTNEVKSQCTRLENGNVEVVFIADMDAFSYKVYDVVPSDEPCCLENELSIKNNTIQNQRYSVALNDNGDIVSIIDKINEDRELLNDTITLGLYKGNGSKMWPSWEIDYNQINKEEDASPKLDKMSIVEDGCARVTFKVEQSYNNSHFVSYISLIDGGNIIEVRNEIDWQERCTLAKQKFSFTAKNSVASFDLGLGVIERPNMNSKLYEVPCQKWANINDESGEFGVSVISQCKYGFDKFDDNTLRMTIVHTPKYDYRKQSKQSMLDLGLNKYSYAIYSHDASNQGDIQNEARAFVQPMVGAIDGKHSGKLGLKYSFLDTNDTRVIVRAVKKAQTGDVVIVRLNEGSGKEIENYKLKLGNGVKQAVELYASEEFKATAKAKNGYLITDFKPYEVKTFAFVLEDNKLYGVKEAKSYKVKCDYDKNIVSRKHYLNNDFEYFIPKDLIKENIEACGTVFEIDTRGNNAIIPSGNVLELKHRSNEVKILMTSMSGDRDVKFLVDDKEVIKRVNDAFENWACWDMYSQGKVAYVKDGCLGYEATHCLNQKGQDGIAKNMYFWVITLDTKGATKITLPNDKDLAIIGINEIVNSPNVKLVTELYDDIKD